MVTIQITASFTFYDKEGDEEGTTRYRWIQYESTDCEEEDENLLDATSDKYTPSGCNDGYKVDVTPVSATGTADGNTVRSACFKFNCAP